jgi:DNA-binding NarL/FixJ family response regulator
VSENTIKILIATDVSESLEEIKRIVAITPDIEIVGASRTREAIVRLAREIDEADVVVMDYDMPGMDGAEATRSILQDNPRIQVIMLSLVNDADDIRHAMRAGARDYLVRPLDEGELAETIRWLIGERREYERMTAFVKQLRRAYDALFHDDKPIPEKVVTFLESQATEKPADRLTLETLAVAYARNRNWKKLAPLVPILVAMQEQSDSM